MAIQAVKTRPFLEEEQRPSVLKIAGDYVQTPKGLNELVVDPATTTIRWAEIAVTALSEIVQGPKEIFERIGHVLLWAEIPTQLMKLGRSIVKLKDSIASRSVLLTADKVGKVYVNATFFTGLVADGAQVLYRAGILPLSSVALVALQALGLVGSVALLVKAGRGIIKNFNLLRNYEAWTPQFNFVLIRLVAKILLLVVAIFSIAAVFYSFGPLIWIILIFSTLLLIASLAEYFYEKKYFGEKAKAAPAATQAAT